MDSERWNDIDNQRLIMFGACGRWHEPAVGVSVSRRGAVIQESPYETAYSMAVEAFSSLGRFELLDSSLGISVCFMGE